MSRRCFAQSSFADAFVKAYSKAGGFLEDLQQDDRMVGFRRVVCADQRQYERRARLPAADNVQDRAFTAMVQSVRPASRRSRARPDVVSALLRHSARRRDPGSLIHLAVPANDPKARPVGRVLAEVNRQLDARGLIVKKGTLVDATIIAAAVKRPPYEEGQVNPRDPDASFTIKNDKTYFGYKAHIAVDEQSDLIRQAEMTSADLHDSQRGEAMIQGDERPITPTRLTTAKPCGKSSFRSASTTRSPTRPSATSR